MSLQSMEKFKGLFLNEKGEKVQWWFNAPGEAVLREDLAQKGWNILSLSRVEQVNDPVILARLEEHRQRTILYMLLAAGLFVFACGLLILREAEAIARFLWTVLFSIWAAGTAALAVVWLGTRCPYCQRLVHKPGIPFNSTRWLFREYFMRCDQCNIDFNGVVEIPLGK